MLKRRKTNINYILSGLSILLLSTITFHIQAKTKNFSSYFNFLIKNQDTTPIKKTIADTTIHDTTHHAIDTTHENNTDTSLHKNDTTRRQTVDTLSLSKDSLDAQIDYTADDSGVLIIPKKQFMLYGKADAKYTDITLDANTIIYDQQTQIIKAYGGTD